MVTVNGEEKDCAGMTLAGYLQTTAYDPARIAVEKNGQIVPKKDYQHTVLQERDVLEIVSFVGGG